MIYTEKEYQKFIVLHVTIRLIKELLVLYKDNPKLLEKENLIEFQNIYIAMAYVAMEYATTYLPKTIDKEEYIKQVISSAKEFDEHNYMYIDDMIEQVQAMLNEDNKDDE